MLFNFLDDRFLLDSSLEPFQRALERFSFFDDNKSHEIHLLLYGKYRLYTRTGILSQVGSDYLAPKHAAHMPGKYECGSTSSLALLPIKLNIKEDPFPIATRTVISVERGSPPEKITKFS
jgi:hypothetical protein